MDKIQEKFKKLDHEARESLNKVLTNSPDLLPTEKVCPDCGGSDRAEWPGNSMPKIVTIDDKRVCPKCKKGKVQIYYTPEQYEKIMGKPYPDDALVWVYEDWQLDYGMHYRKHTKDHEFTVIVQTAQPAPPADYRPEE